MLQTLFLAGIATISLGFVAHGRIADPALLQGALTLGGAWIICGLFALRSKWHGFIGGGVIALLGAARCAPALLDLPTKPNPATPYQVAALGICLVVLTASLRATLKERARRQRASLLGQEEAER